MWVVCHLLSEWQIIFRSSAFALVKIWYDKIRYDDDVKDKIWESHLHRADQVESTNLNSSIFILTTAHLAENMVLWFLVGQIANWKWVRCFIQIKWWGHSPFTVEKYVRSKFEQQLVAEAGVWSPDCQIVWWWKSLQTLLATAFPLQPCLALPCLGLPAADGQGPQTAFRQCSLLNPTFSTSLYNYISLLGTFSCTKLSVFF